jgi:glycine/D-amino acid oxidase-like deaminating enzyme
MNTDTASYWQTGDTPEPLASSTLPETCEVVVVGAGVVGCATALWLARAGLRPVLIDREWPGFGASGRNGGMIISGSAEGYTELIAAQGHAAARDIWQFSVDGLRLMLQLIAEEEIACELQEGGHLSLVLSQAAMERQQRAVTALQADGFPVELLDREAVQAAVKTPPSRDVVGGRYNRLGATVHSGRLVAGLAAAVLRQGGMFCRADLQAIQSDGAGLRLETDQGDLLAGQAVLALNAWSADLLAEFAAPIKLVRGQALAYEPVDLIFGSGMGASLTATGEYWQQRPDGTIVIGGCRALAPKRDVGVRDGWGSPQVQAGIERILPRLFPQMPDLTVAQRWAGSMAFTPDYLPIVDRLPELPQVWFAGGFCGHGMPFAAAVGQSIAQIMSDGDMPAGMAALGRDRASLA